MRFALKGFFKDYLPSVHVGSHIIEGAAVDLNMHGRVWRTIKDSMKGYVSAQPVREKEAANDTFVNDVESSSIVETMEI